MHETTTAVIVAAGTGRRMNSPVKKQYMEISGFPVLYYTIKAFEESDTDSIVIVTGSDEIEYVQREIVDRYGFGKVKSICAGGRERFDSVYAGIKEAGSDYVLIHDGVRMLVTPSLINRCIDAVRGCDACVAAVPVKDTIKEAASSFISRTLDRSSLYMIQTPQCFSTSLILGAFEKMYADSTDRNTGITDDSMLIEEYTDHKVTIVEGDYRNIKITTSEDIELAKVYLEMV